MKQIQGKNIVGFVTIQVKGKRPESFFQRCADENIPIWDVRKKSKRQCSGKVYLFHIQKVKNIAHEYSYEIEITDRRGYINFFTRIWRRKQIVISIIVCSCILFFISNIIWKIEINGVSTNIEEKVNEQLATYGLYEGAWMYSLESLDQIQQEILNDVPELLYIGIEKKGTTYTVDAVEKLIVKEEPALPSQHLIATKNGIIQKMFIEKGSPRVNINDYVRKGDLLVSGVIEEEEQENDESATDKTVTSAEGKVYATTWYEVDVTSSLYHSKEKLTGAKMIKYYLNIGNIHIPIWGFKKIPYKETVKEKDKKALYLLKWQLPFHIIQQTIYDKQSLSSKRSEEEAKEIAIEHVKNDLKVKLGIDTDILNYYVLHESVENGKVKLNLYISTLENIATGQQLQ